MSSSSMLPAYVDDIPLGLYLPPASSATPNRIVAAIISNRKGDNRRNRNRSLPGLGDLHFPFRPAKAELLPLLLSPPPGSRSYLAMATSRRGLRCRRRDRPSISSNTDTDLHYWISDRDCSVVNVATTRTRRPPGRSLERGDGDGHKERLVQAARRRKDGRLCQATALSLAMEPQTSISASLERSGPVRVEEKAESIAWYVDGVY